MEHRRITLADRRYMIFYTFDDEPQAARIPPAGTSAAERSEKERQPETEPSKETPRV